VIPTRPSPFRPLVYDCFSHLPLKTVVPFCPNASTISPPTADHEPILRHSSLSHPEFLTDALSLTAEGFLRPPVDVHPRLARRARFFRPSPRDLETVSISPLIYCFFSPYRYVTPARTRVRFSFVIRSPLEDMQPEYRGPPIPSA